jgi:hypothetical protein
MPISFSRKGAKLAKFEESGSEYSLGVLATGRAHFPEVIP